MQIEINLTPSDLAWAMKDESPEAIVEFVRDLMDHSFNRAESADLVRWLIQFLMDDLEAGRF